MSPEETWRTALTLARKGNVSTLVRILRSNSPLNLEHCLWIRTFIASTLFFDIESGDEIERARVRRYIEHFERSDPPTEVRNSFAALLETVLLTLEKAGNSERMLWEPPDSRIRKPNLHKAIKAYRERRRYDPSSAPREVLAEVAREYHDAVAYNEFERKLKNRLGLN